MKSDLTRGSKARRARLLPLCFLAFAVSTIFSQAFTKAQFTSVQTQITNDITTLAAIESPTRPDRLLLRTMNRASNVLAKPSLDDGRALRSLNVILGRKTNYTPALSLVASNLVAAFNIEYDFVGTLLNELPPSSEATAVRLQYSRLAVGVARLNQATTTAKVAALYDLQKRRLDKVFDRASQVLLVQFPSELPVNSLSAVVNGANFQTSAGAASDNVFLAAVGTDSNINVKVSALLTVGANYPHGILFSVPNAQFGTFRYQIPEAASFTNRTDVYHPETESNVGATNGSIFVSTTEKEVFGSFTCSGPGFSVTDGRFRINLSSQP